MIAKTEVGDVELPKGFFHVKEGVIADGDLCYGTKDGWVKAEPYGRHLHLGIDVRNYLCLARQIAKEAVKA